MRAMSCCGLMPSLSALSMIGAPCASSAPTKCSWCPCILWKRTQMSAWMYSMMCPIWNGPLAYGVGGGRGVDQDLERRHAALLVGALQQLLRNDAPERRRQHGAHVRLLVGGEDVHHAVDRRRRAVGVQRPHYEDAHLGRGDCDAHGLEVAQLADQDHVGVFAQRRVHRGGETRAVHTDLALADEAALSLVHE